MASNSPAPQRGATPNPSGLWRTLFVTWLLLCLGVGIGVAVIAQQGLHFETDLRALLPRDDSGALSEQAGEALFETGGDRLLLLLASPQKATTEAAADWLLARIRQQRLVQLETSAAAQNADAILDLYRQHRFSLLSPRQRESLQRGEAQRLATEAWRGLYQPDSWGRWLTPAEDPLNLFPGWMLALHPLPKGVELAGDYLLLKSPTQPDQSFALIVASSEQTAFDLEAQQQLVAGLDRLGGELLARYPEVQLLRSGIVFHAAAAASQARREITLIGGGSALGIVLLYLLCFASLRPLLLSLASVLFGSLVALCLTHFVFGDLHLLTLVFGAGLIGVAVDYSLHFFTRLYGEPATSPRESLRRVFPGILLAMVTSVIGYASLAQAPLPGLRQIATFSVAGLLGAWLFVVAVSPRLSAPRQRRFPRWLVSLARSPWRLWHYLGPAKGLPLAVCLGVLALLVCQQQLQSAEDVRALYRPDVTLQQQEQRIQALFPGFAANQFLLLRAENPERLLQLDEQLQVELDELRLNQAIGGWQSVGRSLPSVARQQQDYELLSRTVYGDEGVAWPLLQKAGFEGAAITQLQQAFAAYPENWLLPENWVRAADEQQRMLWLAPGEGAASMVTLNGITRVEPLQALARDWPGVEFVDRVGELSELLQNQRDRAGQLLLLAYGAVMLVLILRYRSPVAALLVVVPLLASLLTLATLALAAVPISIFHVFALFLVLGLGMDYSIFSYEAQPGQLDYQLAILLSALTSGLSFGLLALSTTPMVQAFGITVLLGGAGNLLLVPLVSLLASVGHKR